MLAIILVGGAILCAVFVLLGVAASFGLVKVLAVGLILLAIAVAVGNPIVNR